jgi:magnesium-transporting ATPase (P-type)
VTQVLCTSPFSIYVTVATIFNAPPLYFGATQLAGLECRGSQWLVVNGVFCLAHIVAAIYMAVQVKPDASATKSTMARAAHLFCYDPWMALYILVLAGFFVWLWTGAVWSLNGKASNGCQEDDHVSTMAAAMAFGWAFFSLGVAALSIGVCCAYCSGNNNGNTYYSSTTTTTTQYYGATTSKPALDTPFVHIDASDTGGGKVSSPKGQQHIPTVKATLF